jgi:integrase
MTVALAYEHAERGVRTEAGIRRVLSDILERNTGRALQNRTVRDWFGEWLKGKGDETQARYEGITRAFLKHLGGRADQPLTAITPPDVKSYIEAVRAGKVSDKTVAVHLQALKSAFSQARRMQMIESSPADPIKVEVESEIQRELFTETEAKMLLDAAEGEWKTLLLVGYYTGLRLSVAATLRWDAVDLTAKAITVAKPGKGGRAVRIPMHDRLHDHLMRVAATDRTDDSVMPELAGADSGGKAGLSEEFKRIARRAGVDLMEVKRANGHKFCKRTFHSLRHGFVSGLANEGVAPEQRRAITGHKTESVHARYTHLETEVLRDAINKLPALPDDLA